MQLTYRGANYQHNSFQSRNKDTLAIAGKYRGVTYYISSAAFVSRQPLVAYKYRGVNYIKECYFK